MDEFEEENTCEAEETFVFPSYKRKKKRLTREEQLDNLPQVDEEHEIEATHCPCCFSEYIRMEEN